PSTFNNRLEASDPSFVVGIDGKGDRLVERTVSPHLIHPLLLQAASVMALLVVSLTLYTFWAARRGHDFKFLGPFLFCSLVALICFCVIRRLFPFGKITNTILSFIGTIIFSGYIIYDTDNLIKRYSYDDYICASILVLLILL
ncbi:BI1-like protein, partial [Nymphaea thermarum]